LKKDNLKVVQI